MRIAVISDTHDHLPAHLADTIASADEIWHLGDVCYPTVITRLHKLGPPVRVVRGNCDDCEDWPLALDFEKEGFRIHLEHIPLRSPSVPADLWLHGHTHVPRDETVDGTRFLNPGCITRPNRGAPSSFAWLILERDKPVSWKVVLL